MKHSELRVIDSEPAGGKDTRLFAVFGNRVALDERASNHGVAGIHTYTLLSIILLTSNMMIQGRGITEFISGVHNYQTLAADHIFAVNNGLNGLAKQRDPEA